MDQCTLGAFLAARFHITAQLLDPDKRHYSAVCSDEATCCVPCAVLGEADTMQMQMPEPIMPPMPPTLSGQPLPGDDLPPVPVKDLPPEPAPMQMRPYGQ